MPRVQVGYIVPVEAVLDTDTGEVVRVVVVDEEISLDRDDFAEDGKRVHTDGYDAVTDESLRKRALEIAEQADWPAWEFGF